MVRQKDQFFESVTGVYGSNSYTTLKAMELIKHELWLSSYL